MVRFVSKKKMFVKILKVNIKNLTIFKAQNFMNNYFENFFNFKFLKVKINFFQKNLKLSKKFKINYFFIKIL